MRARSELARLGQSEGRGRTREVEAKLRRALDGGVNKDDLRLLSDEEAELVRLALGPAREDVECAAPGTPPS